MDKTKPEKPSSGIRPGVIFAVAVVVGILIAGKFAGWFGGQKQSERETAMAQAPTHVEPVPPRTAPVANSPLTPGLRSPTPVRATPSGTMPGTASTAPGTRPPSTPPGAVAPGAAAVPDAAGEMPDWNDKLDTILGSNEDEARKAEQ